MSSIGALSGPQSYNGGEDLGASREFCNPSDVVGGRQRRLGRLRRLQHGAEEGNDDGCDQRSCYASHDLGPPGVRDLHELAFALSDILVLLHHLIPPVAVAHLSVCLVLHLLRREAPILVVADSS
eukprot:CAMPEP_0176057948 /NCGR_PEP_ID=MMETSP0120_2-20121206/28866_1 /TAXON_ID=160619 /ORGANISM="Kryptoperidinium foliaceum, Strain CCMP 1326" /LENGTH=124 /DNA_ID=CAMNT_0017391465 /DNA_START=432 /DNA_END=803 /DNA_ORIENTATION=-